MVKNTTGWRAITDDRLKLEISRQFNVIIYDRICETKITYLKNIVELTGQWAFRKRLWALKFVWNTSVNVWVRYWYFCVISHKISYAVIERYVVCWKVQIWELLGSRTLKHLETPSEHLLDLPWVVDPEIKSGIFPEYIIICHYLRSVLMR